MCQICKFYKPYKALGMPVSGISGPAPPPEVFIGNAFIRGCLSCFYASHNILFLPKIHTVAARNETQIS